MVRWCIRLTRLTLVCEVIRYRLVQVRQNLKKRHFGLAARNRLSLFLPLSFSPSSHFLSFSIQKCIVPSFYKHADFAPRKRCTKHYAILGDQFIFIQILCSNGCSFDGGGRGLVQSQMNTVCLKKKKTSGIVNCPLVLLQTRVS